jgi:hypothetical protein
VRSTKSLSWVDRLLGGGSIAAPPHVVALRDDALVYARVERRSDGKLQVLRYLETPLATDFADGPLGGPPRDPQAFEASVRELFERAGGRIEETTLVLSDRWLRMVFAEFTELPTTDAARQEALRFKLRQLVPFRAEELRLRAVEVEPLAGQEEPRRMAVAFALEALLGPIESTFERAGVRIGMVTNESLALASALRIDGLGLLVLADERSYTLLVSRDGEPLLSRHKELSAPPFREAVSAVTRELRLTSTFLEERLPGRHLDGVFVAAPEAASWSELVADALGTGCVIVDASALGEELGDLPPGFRFDRGGALLGAALLEVA